MDKCPNCKARIKDSQECYRCGFDFSPVIRCEQTAESYYRKALLSLRSGQLDQAVDYCTNSIFLENHSRSRKLKHFLMLKKLYHV